MKAVIKIEAIGHNNDQLINYFHKQVNSVLDGIGSALFGDWQTRYGVFEVTKHGLVRLHGKTDYSQANSVGSRGVYVFYTLESGKTYLVFSPTSWRKSEKYVCTVNNDGDIIHIPDNEVPRWLENTLG